MADELNFQLPKEGFDSYLSGILPENQAVLAGAFSVSMQQVKNLSQLSHTDIEKFAKITYSLETNVGLPLTNGTDIPTDQTVVTPALVKIGLGTGLYGTYTHSDFLGAMSGLPYPLNGIYNDIISLQTKKLINIYQEMYLAVCWEGATLQINYSSYQVQVSPGPPPVYATYYHIDSISIINHGGGYGRGTAPAPAITITGGSGAIATCTVGDDTNDVGSAGMYGRITTVTLVSSGTDTTSIPTISIEWPPTATLPVQPSGNKATGGTNTPYGTAGWSGMNGVVQQYIGQSNDEIQHVLSINYKGSRVLNANYSQLGTALKIEQRSRYIAMSPVAVPKNKFLAPYPSSLYTFTDNIPEISANTMPHGPVQTLEMISDYNTIGGQSLVALMRQERNQIRLAQIDVPLENNIPDQLSNDDQQLLLANGTKCGATLDTGIVADNGLSFPIPAFASQLNSNNQIIVPKKNTYFDSTEQTLIKVDQVKPGSIEPLLENPNCNVVAGPQIPVGPGVLLPTGIPDFVTGETANVLPNTLNVDYTNGVLLPSQFNITDAIDNVVACNCDCWVQ